METSAPMTNKMSPESDSQIAALALQEFERGDYKTCLKTLNKLQAKRPQDKKVSHNIYITEFYMSKCTKVVELFANLMSLKCQEHNDSDVDSVDDVEQCYLFYNLALVMLQLRRVKEAVYILERISQLFDPLDEPLGRKIFLCLASAHLAAYEPHKALGVTNYIDSVFSPSGKSGKVQEEGKEALMTEDEKVRLAQVKARCYAMMKSMKSCKREVKTLVTSGAKARQIAGYYMRSQMEYQKGNHKKAAKILNSVEYPNETIEFFLETGDCLHALYGNNMGCIMFGMEKPRLAVLYVERGLKELSEELNKMKTKKNGGLASKPLHMFCLDERVAMTYNLAMHYFKAKEYKKAFELFLEVREFFQNNPKVWLKIAECCIQTHKMNSEDNSHTEFPRAPVGVGVHKKISLTPSKIESSSMGSNTKELPVSMTLDYAMTALRYALLLLLPQSEPLLSESRNDPSVSAPLAEEKDDKNSSDVSVPVRPCYGMNETDVEDLRNSVLLASSYVSLRLGDFIMSREYAAQLLSQPKISECQRFLAHMYTGEALVKIDRISEAVEHFNFYVSTEAPLNYQKPSLPNQNKSSSSSKTENQQEESSSSTVRSYELEPPWNIPVKLVAQYNLALVYAMRGEWSKSLILANEIMAHDNAPLQTKALIVYIHLGRGATDLALSYLRGERQKKTSFLFDWDDDGDKNNG